MYDNGFARAAEALRDAVADAATDPAVLVQSFLLLSFALVNTGDYDESLHYARQALTLAEELDVPALTSQVLAMWVTVALMCGQGVDEPRLQRALGLEDPDVDVPIPFRASAVNGLALAWTGRLDEARAQMRAVRNRCIERGAHTHIMFIALHSTLIDVWRGRVRGSGTDRRGRDRTRGAAGDRVPRRIHDRPCRAWRDGRRSAADPVEHRGVDSRRSAAASRAARRGAGVVSNSVGPQRLRPGKGVPAAPGRRVRRPPLTDETETRADGLHT